MHSEEVPQVVTPAKAGVQNAWERLDSRLRGNDRKALLETSSSSSILRKSYYKGSQRIGSRRNKEANDYFTVRA
jgi:hypothetical protein